MTGTRLWLLGVAGAAVLAATPACAQSPADSTAAPPSAALSPADSTAAPPSAAAPPPAAPVAERTKSDTAPDEAARDKDRFEVGAAVASGPFDVLGTFGYRRLLRRGEPFEWWVHLELSGGSAGYLREGAGSVAFLMKPVRFIHRDWPIRPILEFGPAGHVVFQQADIRGIGETAFHTHVYLKTHAYAGFDIPLSSHFGLVARGRLTVPTHKALDYAQIALFLR